MENNNPEMIFLFWHKFPLNLILIHGIESRDFFSLTTLQKEGEDGKVNFEREISVMKLKRVIAVQLIWWNIWQRKLLENAQGDSRQSILHAPLIPSLCLSSPICTPFAEAQLPIEFESRRISSENKSLSELHWDWYTCFWSITLLILFCEGKCNKFPFAIALSFLFFSFSSILSIGNIFTQTPWAEWEAESEKGVFIVAREVGVGLTGKWWQNKSERKGNKFLFRNTFDRLNVVKAFYSLRDINLKGSESTADRTICFAILLLPRFFFHGRREKE